MSEPFISEIRMFSFNFAPRNWAFCDGQMLPINQNQTLYSLLGTTFGGDGRSSFALPDLRGRVPVHAITSEIGLSMGLRSGEEKVVLNDAAMAAHTHQVNGSPGNGNTKTFEGSVFAAGYDARATKGGPLDMYAAGTNLVTLHPGSVSNSGNTQGHNNVQPSLVVNFCIATSGLFPSRN
ncbi:phage tail protein [Cognaticolwellia mytili]|uniref:phage tail protein n=1 Tax=Cognaticolwellia mytili TaxID=1888913 RepID=UPI000A16EBF2|nr:tail fiber protein [Cognaticolwellia mytili]